MPTDLLKSLQDVLKLRERNDALRTLTVRNHLVDFCSNDYLGFARSECLRSGVRVAEDENPLRFIGATGSRLLSGNSELAESLEREVASYHNADHSLIFNSGYDANLAVFSTVPQRGDTVVYDELVHASIRDGLRLGFARHYAFRHNDVEHLRKKIKQAGGRVFIAVESVYSMDGDLAPLGDLASVCDETGAALIVDEAHATGVFGPGGAGCVVQAGLQHSVFARIHTFGKALGIHGAAVLGSETLRSYLINFARPFIYTTALPSSSLLAIRAAYQELGESESIRRRLHDLIRCFREHASGLEVLDSASAIQGISIPGNAACRRCARQLQDQGFDVRAILHPTVARGKERLRICLHAFNTPDEIKGLLDLARKII